MCVGCSQKLLFVTYSTVSVIFSLRGWAGPATNHIKYANAGAVSLLLCLYKGTMMWFIHIHVRQNNIFWMDTSVSSLQRLYMVLQRVCAALIPRPVARNTAVEPSYGGALAPQRPCASICRVWAALYKDSSKYTGHLEGNLAWAEIEISCFFSVLACCYGLYFAAALLQITYTRLWPWISSLMCLLLQGYHHILDHRLYF